MSTTAHSSTNEMSPSEHRDGEALIAELQSVITGHDPALAAYALVSTLATLATSHAANPAAQAKRLGELLVETVLSPPVNRVTQ